MNISLHQSCLDVFKSAEGEPHRDALFMKEFSEQAHLAWETREDGQNMTRFLFALPKEHGQHFHFFTVSLHRHRKDLINVRG
ncbi:hypothetical protein [Rodentibacter myodis]|uniref:Uncharacterized protein n=1 Tax=Rodentibacter myodis TaxID=1907939 RepID=A0A1V3JTD4_9PAST|nr:hypothetical protein [Rodentibacter myodis]OOF59713.1 hypothetical protein BKL49_02685 [Rodentibacter myodis]